MTPPRGTSPRDSRSRSHINQDYEDPQSSRSSRGNRGGEPIGMTFRMNACEQSLQLHTSELTAQRLMLSQFTDEIKRMIVEKDANGQRLDAVFAFVDQRFSESQVSIVNTQEAAYAQIEQITGTINPPAQSVSARLEQLTTEIATLKSAPPVAPVHEPPPGIPSNTIP